MEFKAKKIPESGQGQWKVIITGTEWKEFIEKAKNSFKSKLSIPGFRKGKVPENLVKKHLTEEKLLNEAHNFVLKKAYDYAITQKSQIEPYTTPEIEIEKLSMNEYILNFNFDIKPEINIKKYTGFKDIKKEPVNVTEKQINQSIDSYREKFAIYADKTTAISKGDLVKFDFIGYVNGEPFPGGNAVDFTLEIGSNKFIPGFEDKMIGLKIGESKIAVKFPDDYHVENLKSQPAEFNLNIKEIKSKTLPKIDEELVKDVNLPDVNNISEFKKFIKNSIHTQLKKSETDRFIGELFQKIIQDSNIIIPSSIVNKEANKLEVEFEQKLKAKQIDKKFYKEQSGLTDEDIKNELIIDARSRIANGSIVEFIKQKEQIKASENEVADQFNQLAKQFNIDVKTLKNGIVSEEQIKTQVTNDKVFEFLYENNGAQEKIEKAIKPTKPLEQPNQK
ncbi:trigger factor [Spiroplasma endosymbiont of Amphibalanus improvisus]|uniref:trigger factor n=1 Tax=Spiroplasma endosymbiont of Amphibalanus improvisus TaxID=3066327 RepID=UPI00313B6121